MEQSNAVAQVYAQNPRPVVSARNAAVNGDKCAMAQVHALLRRPLLRFMSTTASTSPVRQRQLFFIWAPDKTEEGTFARRISVRNNHLESAKENISGGFIRVAGAVLTPDASKKMIGSTFICEAESIEEVTEMIEKDVYYTSGVWDRKKMVILPFLPATSVP